MELIRQYGGLKREAYVLFFGRIVTSLGSMIWPVLTLILNQKLGMSASLVALCMIIVAAVSMPAGIIGGKLADHYDKKYCIVACDLVSVVLFITCAFIPLSLFSIILLTVASIFQTIEQPAYDALVADITLTKDREKAYSLLYLGGNIGMVASPTIAGFLFKNLLWLSFLISGIGIFISTICIFFLVKDYTPLEVTEATDIYQQDAGEESAYSVLKRNPVLTLFIVISCIYWGAYSMYGFLMPIDMAAVHGDDGAMIFGTVSSVNCIVVVLFTPVLTKLLAGLSHPAKCLLGQFFTMTGYMLFLRFLGFIPSYYMAMVLFTFGEILCTITNGPYISDRIPASHRGRINGIMGVIQSATMTGINLGSGFLYDKLGSGMAWGFVIGMLVLACALSVLLMFVDKKAYKNLYN